MDTDISEKLLFQILNKTIGLCINPKEEEIDKDANRFLDSYMTLLKQKSGLQQNIFEERFPSCREVKEIVELCQILERYRYTLTLNALYAKTGEDLSEQQYRCLYEGLNRYREHISPENADIAKKIETAAKRQLPEFKKYFLLKDFFNEAQRIYKMKKGVDREYRTGAFFTSLKKNKELKEMPPSFQKLELCQICICLVNYLPEEVRRIRKFSMKVTLNKAVAEMAQTLMNQETDTQKKNEYQKIMLTAQKDEMRFQRCIDIMKNYKNGKTTKRPMSIEELNRIAFEEWLYL